MEKTAKHKEERALKRRRRVRGKIHGTPEIPRLTVTKSLKNTFIQIVDDINQVTLVGLSTNSKSMAGKFADGDKKTDRARKAGQAIAEMAVEKGIKKVVFDRNRYRYHGRIKAVAEGAREKGLEF
jgi:large subunit ribosomal protein L18